MNRITTSLWAATFFTLAAGAWLWHSAVPESQAAAPGPTRYTISIQAADLETPDTLLTMSNLIVQGDVFRLARRPADVPYGAEPVMTTAVVRAQAPPKPRLTLSGILGGPPWDALLDGVPGTSAGVLVREGDTLSGLRIERVTSDSVVVSGKDTTWRLGLKEIWR